MSIVSFEKIGVISTGDAMPITGDGFPIPAGPTANGDRPTLYDPLWGYFTFRQQVDFRSAANRRYRSYATFTIRGDFTPNAEAGRQDPDLSDAQRFDACSAKYMALESALISAADKQAPTSFKDWGTDADPRCIPLPPPLVDRWGRKICVYPVSLNVLPSRWPSGISYEAVLTESPQPTHKLKLVRGETDEELAKGTYIDDAQVQITLPSPILQRHRLTGCTGEILQLLNYTAASFEIAGTLPQGQSGLVGPDAMGFLTGTSGVIRVLLEDREAVQMLQFGGVLDMDGGQIESDLSGREDRIRIRGVARF